MKNSAEEEIAVDGGIEEDNDADDLLELSTMPWLVVVRGIRK